jgi:hypothetical protein
LYRRGGIHVSEGEWYSWIDGYLMILNLTKNVQSDIDLIESQLAQYRVDYLEEVPPQIQVGERHLLGLTDRFHELRRLDIRFRGKRLLGYVIFLQ